MNFSQDERLDPANYYKIDSETLKRLITFNEFNSIEDIMFKKLEKTSGDLYAKYFTSVIPKEDEESLHNFGVIDEKSRKYSFMIPEHILSKLFELEIMTEVTKESEIAQLLLLGIDTSFKGV